MRGHTEVIRIRLQGVCPKIVFLNDYPCQTDWFDAGGHATVCTHNEAISSLDLRFLAGLVVSISADTESRAKRLFERAKTCGAVVVAACHVTPSGPLGWGQIYRMEHEKNDAISG